MLPLQWRPVMGSPRYSAWIGEAHCIGVGLSYDALLTKVMEFTMRAAVARSADESDWEHEELRRDGLAALELARNEKALWDNPKLFAEELAEAQREHVARRFRAQNELDPAFYDGFDRDLCTRWHRLGYKTPSLRDDMKPLFLELERDISDRATDARRRILADFITALEDTL